MFPLGFRFGGDHSFNTVTVIIYVITCSLKTDSGAGVETHTCSPGTGGTGKEDRCKLGVSLGCTVSRLESWALSQTKQNQANPLLTGTLEWQESGCSYTGLRPNLIQNCLSQSK